MLPSVSAGSAALRLYAHAAAAAGDPRARAADPAVRQDRDRPAQGGSGPATARAEARIDDTAVVRESKAAVQAMLDLLRSRVLVALLEAGLPEATAVTASDRAGTALANAIATDSSHAAQIVHAVTERLLAGEAFSGAAILHLAARGLSIVVDGASGAAEASIETLIIDPPDGIDPAPNHHLIDFTDGHSDEAAPILRILAAVRETAAAATEQPAGAVSRPVAAAAEAAAPRSVLAPAAFAAALRDRIAPELAAAGFPEASAAPYATAVSRLLVAALGNGKHPPGLATAAETLDAISRLATVRLAAAGGPEAPQPSGAPVDAHGRISLAAGPLAVVFDPRQGALTVRIGTKAVAVAPASLAPPAAWVAPLPDLDRLPLPSFASDAGLLAPAAIGAPAVGAMPAAAPAGRAGAAGAAGAADPEPKPDRRTAMSAVLELDRETVRLIETAVARNATLFRSLLASPAGDGKPTVRISLDIGAAVAPAPAAAVETARLGRFGLPNAAPAQGEKGPVHADGYDDGTATKPPVLPAWHAIGEMARSPAHPLPKPEKRQRKLSYRTDPQAIADDADAFAREMPNDFEGVVVPSVKLSA